MKLESDLAPSSAHPRGLDIPRVVKLLMVLQDIDRADLLKALCISKVTLSERLSGKSPFKDYELAVLADLFRVDVGVLFTGPGKLLAISNDMCLSPDFAFGSGQAA